MTGQNAKYFTIQVGDPDKSVMRIPEAEPPNGVMAHLFNVDPARGQIVSITPQEPGPHSSKQGCRVLTSLMGHDGPQQADRQVVGREMETG